MANGKSEKDVWSFEREIVSNDHRLFQLLCNREIPLANSMSKHMCNIWIEIETQQDKDVAYGMPFNTSRRLMARPNAFPPYVCNNNVPI